MSPRVFATGGTVASPNGHGGPYNVEARPADRKLLDEHLATKPDLARIGQDEHGWGTRPQINGRHSRDLGFGIWNSGG